MTEKSKVILFVHQIAKIPKGLMPSSMIGAELLTWKPSIRHMLVTSTFQVGVTLSPHYKQYNNFWEIVSTSTYNIVAWIKLGRIYNYV